MSIAIVPMARRRAYPPRVSPFTQPFWNALEQGRWTTSRCRICQRQTFPPKSICPHCWSTEVEWSELQSHGRLYSWTRVHAAPAVFADEAPYVVGIVDLDGGIRIACRIMAGAGPIAVGSKVEMVCLQYEDGPLFAARLVS